MVQLRSSTVSMATTAIGSHGQDAQTGSDCNQEDAPLHAFPSVGDIAQLDEHLLYHQASNMCKKLIGQTISSSPFDPIVHEQDYQP